MSNATRRATQILDDASISESDARTLLGLESDARIGAADAERAVELNSGEMDQLSSYDLIDFTVESQPLYLEDGTEVPGRRALVREDNGRILNLVSDQYKVVQHRDVFQQAYEAIQRNGLTVQKETARVAMDGAYAAYHFHLDMQEEVKSGDVLQWVIRARNSFNYEAPVELSFGAYRLICSNGMTIPAFEGADGLFRAGGRHRLGLDVEAAVSEIQHFLAAAPTIVSQFQNWTAQEITADRLEAVLGRVAEIGKRAGEAIVDRFQHEEEQTVWSAYNAVTWYASHELTGRQGSDRLPITQETIQRRANRVAELLTVSR